MTKRVRDALRDAELARQRARLFNEARRVLARRYLGNTDPNLSFEALSRVLESLLVAANAAEQDAQRELSAQVTARRVPKSSRNHQSAALTHADEEFERT